MNQIVLALPVAASAALAAYSLPEPRPVSEPMPEAGNLPDAIVPDPNHLEVYLACSEEAERRILSYPEAVECLDRYLLLKLSFLPDVGIEAYARLDPVERWSVNQRGYAAYVAWKAGARLGN